MSLGKIVAIDYGTKRCGIAETDDLQMMAFGLTAVDTPKLLPFLKKYMTENTVKELVVGESKDLQGNDNPVETHIKAFVKTCQKEMPDLTIQRQDERFTSKMAQQSLIDMGKKKKTRQNKYLIDEVSATLILQAYLETLQ